MSLYSLRTKMGLAISALITILIIVMTLYAFSYFKTVYRTTIIQQETLLVDTMARQIEDKLDSVQTALVVTSKGVTPDIVADPEKAQAFLDEKNGLITMFDNHIFIFSVTGTIIAESPYQADRRGMDFSHREYIKTTLKIGRPVIGEPYISSQAHNDPAVMLTAPVYDQSGKMIAIMAGGLDLLKDNFLGTLPSAKIGKEGYFYLFNANRILIIHPNAKRILKQDIPEGANKLYDQAIEGFDVSGDTVNSSGVPLMATFKHLKNSNWILSANHPLGEIYAPFIEAEKFAMFFTPLWMLLVIMGVWYVVANMTMPLALLTQHVEGIGLKEGKERFSSILPRDEIGALSKAFNTMLQELDTKTDSLQHAHDVLESKVEERTQELSSANQEHIAMNEELMAMNEELQDEISERERMEQQLTEAIENLKTMQIHLIQSEKMAALGNLVAGVAHEINTPVGVCITASSHLELITKDFLGLCKHGSPLRQDLVDYLESVEQSSVIICKNLERAGKLIQSFKQVAADQSSEVQRVFNIKKYLEEILLSMNPSIRRTKQCITIECDEHIYLNGFPGAFAQVVTNLVMNSLTHAYERKDQGNIHIAVQKEERQIILIYSDDGKGMEGDVLTRVFDPFFTTKRGTGGTGLGLHVVYNIITQQFGGKIECESAVGKGSTFRIVLPTENVG